MTEDITHQSLMWVELGKLVELVRSHKAKSIETKVGPFKVKIHRLITTIRIDLQEVGQ